MNDARHGTSALTNHSADDGPRYGEITECELCENERLCTDRFGLVTCQRCQAEFLP